VSEATFKLLKTFSGLCLTFEFSRLSLPRSRTLHTTWWRLGAAAAYTKFHAGYKISIPHFLFRGVTAAVAPNRSLAAGTFSRL